MAITKEMASAPSAEKRALKNENLQLKARIAELERLVVRDTLTPLYNRRHFMAELDRWCWRKHRYGGDYALLFIDVDGMKKVNDDHGHNAGDTILIAVAEALLANVRRSDLVARIGGDEFAILLDNMPEDQLNEKIVKLVKSVSNLVIDYEGLALKLAISVGHTVIESGVKANDLILRADRSMYAVKKAKP